MIYKYGDMFEDRHDKDTWTLFTGNSYVNKNDELVMGRGAALQAKKIWPALPKFLGMIIANDCGHLGDYYLIGDGIMRVGVFQVKRHFKSPAALDIINHSARTLVSWATASPQLTFNLNYPGIGYGRLTVGEVEPLLQYLPDNVHVWRFKE